MLVRSNIRGLQTFCVAAQHLSFKEAASDLCLTPSAVSHQISELEGHLGAKLFKRSTRSIALTNEGAALYQDISPSLKTIEDATDKIRKSETRDSLLVQLPEFFASELLMPHINEFTSENREIDLNIEGLDVEGELNSEADITVVLTRKTPKARKVARLFPISYMPVCSPSRLKDVGSEDEAVINVINNATLMLHKARPYAWHQWAENAGLSKLNPRKIIFVDSMFALARAAEQGVGIALLPLPVSQDWLNTGSLVPLHTSHLATEDFYWILINGNSSRQRSALLFFQWMLDKFQKYR